MKVTILGCGSSGGVPRIDGNWGACDPAEPRNRRRRCAIVVEEGGRRLLVDTPPDLRDQLLDAKIDRIDAVLYTHDHADQVHGIDDLRVFAYTRRELVDIHADGATLAGLRQRFGYIFAQPDGSNYPPIARAHELPAAGPFDAGGIAGLGFVQQHGEITSLGLRFGPLAYSADVNALSEAAFEALAGIEVWIVDALRYDPHPSHSHLARTLDWIARVRPRRAILTNMHIDMDYKTLCDDLPAGVEPAHDGMVIEL